jgi:hypothetical protein
MGLRATGADKIISELCQNKKQHLPRHSNTTFVVIEKEKFGNKKDK